LSLVVKRGDGFQQVAKDIAGTRKPTAPAMVWVSALARWTAGMRRI
jgi:hypothetical protein